MAEHAWRFNNVRVARIFCKTPRCRVVNWISNSSSPAWIISVFITSNSPYFAMEIKVPPDFRNTAFVYKWLLFPSDWLPINPISGLIEVENYILFLLDWVVISDVGDWIHLSFVIVILPHYLSDLPPGLRLSPHTFTNEFHSLHAVRLECDWVSPCFKEVKEKTTFYRYEIGLSHIPSWIDLCFIFPSGTIISAWHYIYISRRRCKVVGSTTPAKIESSFVLDPAQAIIRWLDWYFFRKFDIRRHQHGRAWNINLPFFPFSSNLVIELPEIFLSV